MLAAIKTKMPREIKVNELLTGDLSHGEVLIKVEYCGVCGSDLHAFNHAPGYEFVDMPRILGHEVSGTVVEVLNKEHINLLNKRVITESIQYCKKCSNCLKEKTHICENFQVRGLHLDGGMAQYMKCDARFVQEIPNDLPLSLASLAEPMSIAVHAVETIGKVKEGDVVLVQGPGIIGFFCGLVCLSQGARVILSGLSEDYHARLCYASKFGMESYIVGSSDIPFDKVDVLLECSGSVKAVEEGIKVLKKGGKAVFVALYEEESTFFLTKAVRNEWAFLFSYGCRPEDYLRSFEIIKRFSEPLEEVVAYYPLEKVNQAFEDAMQKKVLKPVLKMEEMFRNKKQNI